VYFAQVLIAVMCLAGHVHTAAAGLRRQLKSR
jgi:hypothetical protein